MDMPTPATMIAGEKPLEGRVAIVTGSTSGIGLGIARAFAAAGADVVINGIADQRVIDELCSECAGLGKRAVYDGANLMDPAACVGLVISLLGLGWPVWLLLSVWPAFAVVLSLVLMPMLKGLMVASQLKHKVRDE